MRTAPASSRLHWPQIALLRPGERIVKRLEHHHFISLGMASDRGAGLVAGYQTACDMALWVADYFHELRDLYEVLHQLERRAYAAMDTEYEAARTFANAKSAAQSAQATGTL